MVTIILIIVLAIFLFLFFSYPRRRFTPPTHDIETPMGRTTLYHFRSKQRHGKGEIVLVHGFCENQMYFKEVAEKLTEEGYDCLGLNLFGYNGSIPNNEANYTIEAYAKEIKESLQELERLRMIKNLVAVWGHSMGATAVFLASNDIIRMHPEIRGIFLENPGFSSTLSLFSRLLKPVAYMASFMGPRKIAQFFVNILFGRNIHHPDARQFIKQIVSNFAPTRIVAVKNIQSILKTKFSLEALNETTLKKLYFIFSQKDKLISLRKVQKHVIEALRSNQNFNEEQLWIVPKVDHFISLQAPEQISDFVIKQIKAREALFTVH